jgi:hypothetical protein
MYLDRGGSKNGKKRKNYSIGEKSEQGLDGATTIYE